MKLTNIGYTQVTRCDWSDGAYSIPADATAEVPDAVGGRLLARFPGAFVVVEDAAPVVTDRTAPPSVQPDPAVEAPPFVELEVSAPRGRGRKNRKG
jgi:hypothetical protein